MGCDIHAYAETRTADGTWEWIENFDPDADTRHGDEVWEVFPDRDYDLFGFLADVRNYSLVPTLAQPRGLPADTSAHVRAEHDLDVHSASWFTAAELLAHDYEQTFVDQRRAGYEPVPEGGSERISLRDFLGPRYFARLDLLAKLGDPANVRVVMWFNS